MSRRQPTTRACTIAAVMSLSSGLVGSAPPFILRKPFFSHSLQKAMRQAANIGSTSARMVCPEKGGTVH
jgi:hypothetical protein